MALAPLSSLVWGYERIVEFINNDVAKELEGISPENLMTPSPLVAVPTLESLRYAGHDPTLRRMFAKLLANTMDARTAKSAHPAFVEIIRQLTPDEGKIIDVMSLGQNFPVVSVDIAEDRVIDGVARSTTDWSLRHFSLLPYMALCDNPELGGVYLQNICRLGLATIPQGGLGAEPSHTTADRYPQLESHPVIKDAIAKIEETPGKRAVINKQVIRVLSFGHQFMDACVRPQNHGNAKSQTKG